MEFLGGVLGNKMRSIVKFSRNLSLAGLALFLSMSNVFANTLSEVEINSQDNGYGIVLKTDEAAQMKKIISSNDKMSIELKNVSASENINTVYDNVANLENVTILPASKNDIRITFKGKDIANSKVSFETVKTDALATPIVENQSIKLNGPISSYSPVYNSENFIQEEESQTSNPELNEVLTKMHITREMLLTVKRYAKAIVKKAESAAHGDINFMTIAGIALIIVAFAFRGGKKSNVRPEKSIGIASRDNINREIELNRNLVGNMNSKPSSINSISAANAGYGMRAYQQSQKNPYMTSNTSTNGVSGIARRRPLSASKAVKKQTLSAKPLTSASAPLKQGYANSLNTTVNSPIAPTMPKINNQKTLPQSDLDSMKFLESITKIYENSGRADLAKGLKDNLRKAQMSKV